MWQWRVESLWRQSGTTALIHAEAHSPLLLHRPCTCHCNEKGNGVLLLLGKRVDLWAPLKEWCPVGLAGDTEIHWTCWWLMVLNCFNLVFQVDPTVVFLRSFSGVLTTSFSFFYTPLLFLILSPQSLSSISLSLWIKIQKDFFFLSFYYYFNVLSSTHSLVVIRRELLYWATLYFGTVLSSPICHGC